MDMNLLEEKLKELLDGTLGDFLVQHDIDELRNAITEVVLLASRVEGGS